MLVTLLDITTADKERQPLNAPIPIVVTEEGMLISESDVHPWKARTSIVLTMELLAKVTDFKEVHLWKAPSLSATPASERSALPIAVIDDGM